MRAESRRLCIATALTLVCVAGCGAPVRRVADAGPSASAVTTAPATVEPIGGEPLTLSPSPTSAERKGAAGSKAVITIEDDIVGEVLVSEIRTSTRKLAEYDDGPSNGQYVIANVTVTAVAKFDINPYDFFVRMPDGGRYEPGFVFGGPEPDLHYTELNPGEKIRGYIVFDAAKGRGEVVYAPERLGLYAWRF